MNPEERDRLAERWMEAALRRSAEAEPRPGLEQRILAQLAAAEQESAQAPWWRPPGLRWAVPAVAAAIVLLLVLVLPRHGSKTPTPTMTTNKQTLPSSPPTAAATTNGSAATTARNSPQRTRRIQRKPQPAMVVAQRAPRLEQFPTPGPLSDQEQLLLRYMQRTPATEIAAVVAENRRFEERLREMEDSAPHAPAH